MWAISSRLDVAAGEIRAAKSLGARSSLASARLTSSAVAWKTSSRTRVSGHESSTSKKSNAVSLKNSPQSAQRSRRVRKMPNHHASTSSLGLTPSNPPCTYGTSRKKSRILCVLRVPAVKVFRVFLSHLLQETRQRRGRFRCFPDRSQSGTIREPTSFGSEGEGPCHGSMIGCISQGCVGQALRPLPFPLLPAACEGAPRPASTTTGTFDCSMMIRTISRVLMPLLLPMGAPRGITAAVPTSSRRLASNGSA